MPGGWTVTNMGGQIPIHDDRLLPDNQAAAAWNLDMTSGRLEGLPVPEMIKDLTAVAGAIRRAYRFPGPDPIVDPDVWLPLPSPYSSVVRSPLANDTLQRIYWTNPDGDGGFWNTYARIAAGSPPYRLGFQPVEPYWIPAAVVSGGSVPTSQATSVVLAHPGYGYAPGDILTAQGGGIAYVGGETKITIDHTQVVGISIAAGGSGGSNGLVTLTGTTGVGQYFQVVGTISGGALIALSGLSFFGNYSVNPTSLASEPVSGGGLTGAAVTIVMGALSVYVSYAGDYTVLPPDPTSGLGVDLVNRNFKVVLNFTSNGALPLVARSYLFTYVDEYGIESSPSVPSAVIEGPSDGTWTVYGISNIPPVSFTGENFPDVVAVRVYRTVIGTNTGGQFYKVADITLPPGVDPGVGWVDASLDVDLVNNPVLVSTSWAPPPAGLDGLTSMPGGMLVGFTGNTLHFCEPNRPHAWPASYDLSVNYEIVGLANWQNTLAILTQGFPSTGSGNSPANFALQQVQVAEPCIARGSIVADILGVYYSSPNGLVMLNYYGMQVQTAKICSRKQWLIDFAGAQLIACRHRSQYLALNTVGAGFLIDFAEERRGLVQVNTLDDAVCIWNDVYSGDVYVMSAKKVYRWDSPNTGSMIWRWRSKRWSLPKPITLGASQVTATSLIELPGAGSTTPLDNGDVRLQLPAGVNALFRLYVSDTLMIEKILATEREIFRLPSGFKAFDWQFEIVSRVPIEKVELASTMKELSGV